MASKRKRKSSSYSGTTYQVFLSFRGPDTRQGFTDVLYHALTDSGIRVFRDNEEIRKGEEIGEEILRAIDDSRIFVPIFSRGYASSKWCLIELAEMFQSKLEASSVKKKILPIFYDVRVDDVKLKTELYRGALSKHGEKFSPGTVQKWEEALQEAGKIKGYELKDKGHGEFAKSFVKEVSFKLKVKHTLVTDYLVQRDDLVAALMKRLDIASPDVRFVGIHGMGGIGKSTLAKVAFNELCDRFDHSCFLADVRESSLQKGIEKLQKQVLDRTGLGSGEITDTDEGIMTIRQMLPQKKVLIVLDDVDHRKQIQYLAGEDSWFGPGSRIIITTRDQSVLRDDVQTLEVEVMKPEEALRLFSMHAFDEDSPPNDYLNLSKEVVEGTGRLPLALEVIGSHLWNKPKKEWVATIKRLKNAPHKDVQKTLMISYEALDYGAKQIFLDIACFFINEDKRYPMYMWEACGLDPKMGLKELIHMSLVKIDVGMGKSGRQKWLRMHDQLRDLGRTIVQDESFKDVIKCSRLWWPGDALEVLQSKEEDKENIQMLRLYPYTNQTWTERELSGLRKLRYLQYNGLASFSGDLKGLLPKLAWLSWRLVFKNNNFTATNLCLRNLAILDLSYSEISEDWAGWRQIRVGTKLKVLDLSGCTCLEKTPNLSNYSSLERLILYQCTSLVEIDSSIGELKNLKFLNVVGCDYLKGLPKELCSLDSLQVIMGSGSSRFVRNLFHIPELIGNIKSLLTLELCHFNIIKLPESIGSLSRLRRLSLMSCRRLERLPDSLIEIESLVELDISRTDIVELPQRVGQLVELEILNLDHCIKLKELPDSVGDLRSLVKLHLSWSGITKLPDTIGNLKRLKELHVEYCDYLQEIPSTIEGCTCLRVLHLYQSNVRQLPLKLPTSLTDLRPAEDNRDEIQVLKRTDLKLKLTINLVMSSSSLS